MPDATDPTDAAAPLTDELPTGVRANLATLWLVATTAYRTQRGRALATFGLIALGSISLTVVTYCIKLTVDASAVGHYRVAGRDVVLAGLAFVLGNGCEWQEVRFRLPLVEHTELAFEQQLIDLTTGITGIAHHERAVYADRIEQLRNARHDLGLIVTVLAFNVSVIVAFLGALALLIRVSPWLALLPLAAIPSLWTGARNSKAWQRTEDENAESTRLARHLFELCTTAAPAAELRTFGIGPELRRRRRDLLTTVRHRIAVTRVRTTALDSAGTACFSLAWVAVVTFVVHRAAHHQATPGDVVVAIAVAGEIRGYLNHINGLYGWLLGTLRTISRVRWLQAYADQAKAADGSADAVAVPAGRRDGIRFEGVRFAYAQGEPVLRDLDLLLPAGSTVAIVGENGAGKTTLVKLLCRFYEPTAGHITVDGTDLATFDPAAWRLRTSAVFQDHLHLELPVGETVGVGDLPRLGDDAAVRTALARAGAADLEATLPDGLATALGRSTDTGVELSGGQWQKLALGRGSMRDDPLLLILDEPTSALDPSAEHALFEQYASAANRAARAAGAITVLVSHRFSTVRMADLIVVVDRSTVVESGTHDELVARNGVYAELYELQARTYR